MEKSCEHCGGPLDAHGRGQSRKGRPARYCSVKCKDDARNARARETVQANRGDRRCVNCDQPIPPERSGKATTCSGACSIQYRNRVAAAARRGERRSRRDPCQRCGEDIPESRRAGVIYCSERCKRAAVSQRQRARSPEYMRRYLYGLPAGEFARILAEQGGGCAICGTQDWPGKGPHLDHDHATGKVRGILCGSCNNGLGRFGDDPARLRAAADYLERFRT